VDEGDGASWVVGRGLGAMTVWEGRRDGEGAGDAGRDAGVMARRGAGGVACSSAAAYLLAGKRSLAAGREPSETVAS